MNKKFTLILYLNSTINIIKYKIKTNNTIQKFKSLFLNIQLYSSSKNKESFKTKNTKNTAKISKLNINKNLKIELTLIFLPLHSLF